MKLHLLLLISIVLPPGSLMAARAADLWRPQIIGAAPDADDLQISPNGRWLLAARYTKDYPQGDFQIWNIAACKVVRRYHAAQFWWSADSRFEVVSEESAAPNNDTINQQRRLRIIEAKSGRTIRAWDVLPFRTDEIVNDARFVNHDRELVVATPFRVWHFDVASGKVLSRVNIQIQYQRDPQQSSPPNFQTFFDDGRKLFYSNVGEVFIYDARTGKRLKELDIGGEAPYLSPDGKTALSYNWETGDTRALNVATGRILWRRTIGRPLFSPIFSPDGKFLLAANPDMRLLNARTGQLIRRLALPMPPADDNSAYVFSPDGNCIFFVESGKVMRYRIR